MPRPSRPPAYRCRNIRGRQIAYLTLIDKITKVRRDFWLGPYGSDESRERYVRLLAEWESRGRRLLDSPPRVPVGVGPTVTQVCHAFWQSIQGQYSRSELGNFGSAIKVLREQFGATPAFDFGPNAFRTLRHTVIKSNRWSRRNTNRQMQRIRYVFRWAAGHELLPIAIHQALCAVEPLRRGHGEGRETDPVRPVLDSNVDIIRPLVARQVWAMIELQRLTGMRPGEVCNMRACDRDMTGQIWLYQPTEHKTAYRGHERKIPLGPRAQDVVRPFLVSRAIDAPLFSPTEAEAERRVARHAARTTPLHYGNRPGTNRRERPHRRIGRAYTVASYRRAIARACEVAGAEPWHPHQLRHTYATTVRRQYGLEAAQILLGHSSALITDAVYAERDLSKALEVAAKLG